jgi:hypothetical protein
MGNNMLKKAQPEIVEEYKEFLREFANEFSPSKFFDVSQGYFDFIERSFSPLNRILESYRATNPDNVDLVVSENSDVFATVTMSGHEETESNQRAELTGWLSMPLSERGRLNVEMQTPNADFDSLVLASDLPRTLEHGLRKYYSNNQSVMRQLDDLVRAVRLDMVQSNQSRILPSTYIDFVDLALDNGIIPVPTLRAQFFGFLELFVEKTSQVDKSDRRKLLNQQIISDLKKHLRENGMDEAKIDSDINEMLKYSALRQDIIALPLNPNGEMLFENYLMYFIRSAHSLFQPIQDLNFRKVDIIGHSGYKNIIEAYFRHNGFPTELHIKRSPTPLKRGQKLVIKTNSDYMLLNDPLKVERVKEEVLEKAGKLRRLSLDDRVKQGHCIVNTPLMGFRKKDSTREDYETYEASVYEALSSNKPVIIFGHGGEGKSILLTEIVSKLINNEYSHDNVKDFLNYLPVIVDCNELNHGIRANRAGDNPDMIEKLLTEQLKDLHPCLLDEHKLVFLIDDYHKVNIDYRDSVRKAIENISKKGHLPLIFSRLERSDIHPPVNEGYLTLQVNRDEIPSSIDEFIEQRISSLEKRNSFKEYISMYDESIKGNYITLYVLTLIYDNPLDVKKYFDQEEDAQILNALNSGKPLKKTQLYEIQTQYVIGNDIERRTNGSLPIKDVIAEIRSEKEKLANLAFELVFGKKANGFGQYATK